MPVGRFCKATRLPRNLKLPPCVITCILALALLIPTRLLLSHTCRENKTQTRLACWSPYLALYKLKNSFHQHVEVHMHIPNLFLAWKVTFSIFYLDYTQDRQSSSTSCSARHNIGTCSRRQFLYLETCENPSSFCEVRPQHASDRKGSFSFLVCEWRIACSAQCWLTNPLTWVMTHCSICMQNQALNTSGQREGKGRSWNIERGW